MAISQYEPWSMLNQLHGEVNKLFQHHLNDNRSDSSYVDTAEWTFPVDIKEEQTQFVLLADIPGVDYKDIDITMEKGVLSISGERIVENDSVYSRRERTKGKFYRRFSLPDSAAAEDISARMKNGVLTVIIPKKEQEKPRKIVVSTEE